jgi:AAA+ ATPase superfamily predicted ATPase
VIRDRILAKGESLYEEPLHLLRGEQQIRDPGTYFAVLRAIAGGATQYNEILQQSKVEKNLELLLGRLEELGYIERRRPVELQAKQQRSSYRIADPFFRFWFRYVFPNRSRLERGRGDELLVEIERDLDTFLGLAFEDCCRTWIGTHAPNGRFPASSTLGSWWSRDGQVEIDIAGMSKGHYDVLGSCKWATSVRSRALGDLLAARAHLGGTATNASLVLFARGFSDEIVQRATHERVELVSAADLFS